VDAAFNSTNTKSSTRRSAKKIADYYTIITNFDRSLLDHLVTAVLKFMSQGIFINLLDKTYPQVVTDPVGTPNYFLSDYIYVGGRHGYRHFIKRKYQENSPYMYADPCTARKGRCKWDFN